jgi:hypothetical protein
MRLHEQIDHQPLDGDSHGVGLRDVLTRARIVGDRTSRSRITFLYPNDHQVRDVRMNDDLVLENPRSLSAAPQAEPEAGNVSTTGAKGVM